MKLWSMWSMWSMWTDRKMDAPAPGFPPGSQVQLVNFNDFAHFVVVDCQEATKVEEILASMSLGERANALTFALDRGINMSARILMIWADNPVPVPMSEAAKARLTEEPYVNQEV